MCSILERKTSFTWDQAEFKVNPTEAVLRKIRCSKGIAPTTLSSQRKQNNRTGNQTIFFLLAKHPNNRRECFHLLEKEKHKYEPLTTAKHLQIYCWKFHGIKLTACSLASFHHLGRSTLVSRLTPGCFRSRHSCCAAASVGVAWGRFFGF